MGLRVADKNETMNKEEILMNLLGLNSEMREDEIVEIFAKSLYEAMERYALEKQMELINEMKDSSLISGNTCDFYIIEIRQQLTALKEGK